MNEVEVQTTIRRGLPVRAVATEIDYDPGGYVGDYGSARACMPEYLSVDDFRLEWMGGGECRLEIENTDRERICVELEGAARRMRDEDW